MLAIDSSLQAQDLFPAIQNMWQASAAKIRSIDDSYTPANGTPVFTVRGRYTARGWTEWTQGFQFGSALLQFDATDEREFLELGRSRTIALMAPHITHVGVHDHGFNNVSTYGNLLRLINEGRIDGCPGDRHFYELALKCSAAVQAARWTPVQGGGFIYSFNGPHSLFVDTMRSLRVLAVGHRLGHVLMEENDRRVSLLDRLIQHATATATYGIWYGEGKGPYDVRGRTAHESVFNTNDGNYRCPSTQQGYSPFSTWTRGLAWAMCGFAELLEFLRTLEAEDIAAAESLFRRAAEATCDFYIDNTPTDGVPYWDTGAPNLHRLGHYLERSADPFNDWEPVDASAAAIGAQGLMRLGRYLSSDRYFQAGLTVLRTILDQPYLSIDPHHQGLLLHSVYHRPNGWDHVPEGRRVPCGESSMWGDYHLREAALYVQRIAGNKPYLTF